MKKKNCWWIVGLIVIGIVAMKALYQEGFYTSHDGFSHLSRLAQYIQGLKDGQMPPRWGGGLIGRLGYPIFVYSYQLPYILGSIFNLVVNNLATTMKIVFGLSFVLSGIGAFYWLKEFFEEKVSFLGALFFMFAPYRFSLIFVRAAAGELLALAILPFILWSVTKLIKEVKLKYILLTGLSIGLALMAHSLFLAMYLPIVAGYALFLNWQEKKIVWKPLIISLILGLTLAAFSIGPQILERKYIVFDQVYKGHHAEGHLLELQQLIHSPWGYGFSYPGTEQDAMSFQIGLTQILVFFLIIISRVWKKWSKLTIWQLICFGGTTLLMLNIPITKFFWEKLFFLSVIDIPWRFLGVTTLAAAWLAAVTAESFKPRWLVILGLSLLVVVANRNHLKINQATNFGDEYYQLDLGSTTFLNEYRPVGRISNSTDLVEPRIIALTQNDRLEVIENKSNLLIAKTNFDQPTLVHINILYFPNWQVSVNGKLQDIAINADGYNQFTPQQVSGTMKIQVPAKEQIIRIEFKETPMRKIFNLVSLIAWLITTGGLIWVLKR